MAHDKEWYAQYAESKGYELGKMADKVIESVNKADGYCPCKVALWKKNKPEELDKIICPCVDSDDEIAKMGRCTCCLFYKKGE